MLPILIYVADKIRRALRKIVRSVSIITQTFQEAQEIRRTMPRRSMEE
jgi:hypothetical protein